MGHASDGGKEVAEPPSCAMCVVEVEAAGLDEEAVVRRGLKRVSIVDGGATRERWVRKQGQQDRVGWHAEATRKVRHVGSMRF